MAQLGQVFSASEAPASNDYSPLPAGWYSVRITEAELKDTKAGTGKYIKVRYDVTGGAHAGRVIFGMITVRNPNAKAEEIGRSQLAKLIRSIGLEEVSDTDQLIGGEMLVKVTIRQSEEYGDSNEVKDWKAGSTRSAPAASTPPPPPPGGLPWSK
ncbi:MAG: DUF669 domain-containing protein [Pseudomonadales bacterium]